MNNHNSDTPVTNLNEMYPWQVRTMYEGLDYPKVVLAAVARKLERELSDLKKQYKLALLLSTKRSRKIHSVKQKALL